MMEVLRVLFLFDIVRFTTMHVMSPITAKLGKHDLCESLRIEYIE